jgi:hypothetical protein
MRKPNPGDCPQGTLSPMRLSLPSIDLGKHNVLKDGSVRQEMKRLEYESNALTAQSGPLILAQRCRFDTVEPIAAAGWSIQAADNIE